MPFYLCWILCQRCSAATAVKLGRAAWQFVFCWSDFVVAFSARVQPKAVVVRIVCSVHQALQHLSQLVISRCQMLTAVPNSREQELAENRPSKLVVDITSLLWLVAVFAKHA